MYILRNYATFSSYKFPTPSRSVTEMVGKQTSQPYGNTLLLGCNDCLPKTKYKESGKAQVQAIKADA